MTIPTMTQVMGLLAAELLPVAKLCFTELQATHVLSNPVSVSIHEGKTGRFVHFHLEINLALFLVEHMGKGSARTEDLADLSAVVRFCDLVLMKVSPLYNRERLNLAVTGIFGEALIAVHR